MNQNHSELFQRYFDGQLDISELKQFETDLQTDTELQKQFVEYSLMHDQLRGHFLAGQALSASQSHSTCEDSDSILTEPRQSVVTINGRSRRSWFIAATVAATLFVIFVLWRDNSNTAQAEQTELRRVIAANSANLLRSFELAVESFTAGDAKQKRIEQRENRPPKPPLDGAILHVRGKHEFVLIRKSLDGIPFVTGSDGKSSWAVRPDGPVRISQDLQRFNRDVPGHEYSMPLYNLSEALEHLQSAYELHVLPEPTGESLSTDATVDNSFDNASDTSASSQPQKLLVAIKRKGFPGPRRVEISYLAESGLIAQLRFIDMPYGPDRLTVRLTLTESPAATDNFFNHALYHSPDRKIEVE